MKNSIELHFSRVLVAALVWLVALMFSDTSLAGSRVVDQSAPAPSGMPTEISLDPYYEWLDLPIGSTVEVELIFHHSLDPMPAFPVAIVGPGGPLAVSTGFVDPTVIATVAYDPVLSCTRFVMTVDAVVVAQDFIDHAGTHCRDNFTAFNTLPSVPKGRVRDQSLPAPSGMPTEIFLDPLYEWADVPMGFTVEVDLYFHSSLDPMATLPVATVSPGPLPGPSGFVDPPVVASVAYDPALSCTRFVMRVNGVVVAQDYTDHTGTYCQDNFQIVNTFLLPAAVPTLNTVGLVILALTIATLGVRLLQTRGARTGQTR